MHINRTTEVLASIETILAVTTMKNTTAETVD
jgi:hypothetical protein